MNTPNHHTNQPTRHQNRWHTFLMALLCVLLLNFPIDRTSLNNQPGGVESVVAELLPAHVPAHAASAMQTELPPLSDVAAIAAGGAHTCALTTEGGVKCWGFNEQGQLGNGSTNISRTPAEVLDLSSSVAAIAVGRRHSCALTNGGGVKCWGSNLHGQLGDGSNINSRTPVNVVSGLSSGVIAISLGESHSCALTAEGDIKCWGNNYRGQLGNDSTESSNTPVDVTGLSSSITAIAAGDSHTCALTTSGGVKCWGSDFQLGNGSSSDSSTPVDVVGLSSGITNIAAGSHHNCALTSDGDIKCWGVNEQGQLGNGSNINSRTPVDVLGLSSGVTIIAAGGVHTCALTTEGGVKCWGSNSSGKLGNGSSSDSSTPVDVLGLSSGVTTIAAGLSYTCAVTSDNVTKCWGYNGFGQLGNSSIGWSPTPVEVFGLSSSVTTIATGSGHTCGIISGGGVKCWGSNDYGQLGNGSTSIPNAPVGVVGLSSGVTAIAAGERHSCAVTSGGGVKCWGFNRYGQLGNGTENTSTTPVDVLDLSSGVTAIATGYLHSCALTSGGGVKCWGAGGSLGSGSTNYSATPVNVLGLSSGVSAISVNRYHSCALTNGGDVKCWGSNDFGQLGNGSTSSSLIPVDVLGLSSDVIAITAGGDHTCAVISGGSVKCWGSNTVGQLGDGFTNESPTIVDVSGLSSGATAVAASRYHTCAVISGGSVKCWGLNWSGQLGNGTENTATTPMDVLDLSSGVTAIATGFSHSCAVISGGSVKCWGGNSDGRVNGFPGDESSIPTIVVDPDNDQAVNILGDVNCDELVNAVDALFVLQYVIEQRSDGGGCPLPDDSSLHAAMGDVDDDEAITAVDAFFILRCTAGFSNTFCPEVEAVSVMGAEESVAAAEARRLLREQGLWQEQEIDLFVPLITR